MNGRQRNTIQQSLRWLAVLSVLLFPAFASAGSIIIKNETDTPVVVQAVCVVGRMLVRDKPYLLNKGESTPAIMLPGNKSITIYDTKVANRKLFTGVIADSLLDQHFGIVADTIPPRLKVEPRKAPEKKKP